MPELPEVQTIVTALARCITGSTVVTARLFRTDIITPQGIDFPHLVRGRRIEKVMRRGKRIIFMLETGLRFYIHLGMSGRLTLENPTESAAPHTHLILTLMTEHRSRAEKLSRGVSRNDQITLHFTDPRRFGGIVWLGTAPPDAELGPEPLTLTPAQLARALSCTNRPIKSALLDQHLIAGLGNIYADEALYAAMIHPLRQTSHLSTTEIARLNRAIKSTLRSAIRHGGSTLRDYRTATGEPGGFQGSHRAYGRVGRPCARCGTPIERIVVAGRSTYFCPVCQPL